MDTWVAPRLTGGLGNRLFQYATALGAAKRWDRRATFFIPRTSKNDHDNFTNLFRLFPYTPVVWTAADWETIGQSGNFYQYKELPAKAPGDRVVLDGYYQSPKYFESCVIRPEWSSVLGDVAHKIETESGLGDPEERRRTVALHVRLGDYLKLPHHQQDLSWYYVVALKLVRPGQRVHLFSDEPEKCAEYFRTLVGSYPGLEFTVAAVRTDYETMYEMSLCLGGMIAANSTFSWWGGYFGHQRGSAFVTMPSKWGAGLPPPVDLFPSWVTVIECLPPQEVLKAVP